MVSQRIGDEHLDIYDNLSLENTSERRLKAYSMVDYYCKVISNVSTEYLRFKGDIKTESLKEQWERCRSRLEALDDVSAPDEYNEAVYKLHRIRNDIAHDYQKDPLESDIELIRRVAPEWRSWLVENAEQYDEVEGELDARQTMVRIAQRAVENIVNAEIPYHEPFTSDVEYAKDEVERLSEQLDDLESGDEVSLELVYTLLDAKELDQQVNTALKGDADVDFALSEAAEPRISRE